MLYKALCFANEIRADKYCYSTGPLVIYSGTYRLAGVAKWQTHQTQNLAVATPCGFKSLPRHSRLAG